MRRIPGIKHAMRLTVVVAAVLCICAGQSGAQERGSFKDEKEKKSYAIGVDTVKSTKDLSFQLDADKVAEGMKDAYGNKIKLSDSELNSTLDSVSKELQNKRAERAKNVSEKNKMEGEAFRRENGGRPGIITLPSGLQYKIVKEGKGRTPTAGNTVLVHYRGALINGAEFDNSYVRKKPLEIVVGDKIIPGWTEALLKMKEGARWLVILPPELAYGEKSNGPIGPNSTLMFDIELLSIKR